jgi:hypothetical protein
MCDKGRLQGAVLDASISNTLKHGAPGKTTVNQQGLRVALNQSGITSTATA